MSHSGGQSLLSLIQPVWGALSARLMAVLRRWWENPLLRHARRQKPLPLRRAGQILLATMSVLTALVVLAWITGWRPLGAALTVFSLGVAVMPVLAAPVVTADRVARQMRFFRQDPRRLTDLNPQTVVWGLALVTLWRLRWLIVAALAVMPALVIGLFRLDMVQFAAWHGTSSALGTMSVAAQAGELLPGGRIPYVRLAMGAISAGLLPWVALPLMASLGVTAALTLRDASLSPLAGLLGGAAAAVMIGLGWRVIARTPLLAGPLEMARLLLLIGLLTGLGMLAVWVNRRNAALLAVFVTPEEEQITDSDEVPESS
jgi:hypothetical protein